MKFIRLSQFVINPSQIGMIKVNKNSYQMYLNQLYGVVLFGSGTLDSHIVEVSKKEDPEDYKVVTEWIEENSK